MVAKSLAIAKSLGGISGIQMAEMNDEKKKEYDWLFNDDEEEQEESSRKVRKNRITARNDEEIETDR